MQQQIAKLAQCVLGGQMLDRTDASWLTGVGGDDLYDLFYWANRIRIRYVGHRVKSCAIVAAKLGGCSEDCRFCAQSSHYATAVGGAFRLSDDQILRSAAEAADMGAGSFGIVTSGRGPTRRELHWLRPLFMRIASEARLRLCACLGTLTETTAGLLYDWGVRRINHNLETSERYYPKIVTTHPYSERLRTLHIAKAAGLSVCSGGIFGMGEDWEDRLDLLFALREAGVDAVPINFLNPRPGTPLEHMAKLPPMECLKIIAVCRFVLPDRELKVAGGREACLRDLQSWMFYAGADSTMIGNYLTTCGREASADRQMVLDLGLKWDNRDSCDVSSRRQRSGPESSPEQAGPDRTALLQGGQVQSKAAGCG